MIDEAAIDRLLDREQARFAETHPRSRAAWAAGRQHFLYGGPSHWMRRWAGGFPIYVDRAEGAGIRDIDGRDYVDFCLGDTGGMCGHAPAAVTRAATAQLARGTTTMLPTEDSLWIGAELARLIRRHMTGVVVHSSQSAAELARVTREVGAIGGLSKSLGDRDFTREMTRLIRLTRAELERTAP